MPTCRYLCLSDLDGHSFMECQFAMFHPLSAMIWRKKGVESLFYGAPVHRHYAHPILLFEPSERRHVDEGGNAVKQLFTAKRRSDRTIPLHVLANIDDSATVSLCRLAARQSTIVYLSSKGLRFDSHRSEHCVFWGGEGCHCAAADVFVYFLPFQVTQRF